MRPDSHVTATGALLSLSSRTLTWYDQTMNVTVHLPDDLAARLEAAGADPERLALEALRHAAEQLEQRDQQPAAVTGDDAARRAAARSAAERIIQRRKGVTLGDLTINELINEGRP